MRLPVPNKPVESLSPRKVHQLLRTLRRHIALLDSAYYDAQRLGRDGHRPAYVVDFQLLFRFMLEAGTRPDWEQELSYLFDREQTLFIIGPGTHTEVDTFLRRRGISLDFDEGAPMVTFRESDSAIETLRHRDRVALTRLEGLLAQPNVQTYSAVVQDTAVDVEAFGFAHAILKSRRPSASPEANAADALNWAAVVRLRAVTSGEEVDFFPYLLTATGPLLSGRMWTDEFDEPISRSPVEAIYSEVLFDLYEGRPWAAMDHTVEMSYRASSLATSLKRSPAQRVRPEYVDEPEWDAVIAAGLVGSQLESQLDDLAEFVGDEVIRETQRLYDNAQLFATSAVQQQTEVVDEFEDAPTKLFDLIISLQAALARKREGSAGLGALWRTVLKIRQQTDSDGVVTSRLLESSGDREYLAVERQEGSSGRLFILRWPSALDAARVVEEFSQTYCRASVNLVEVVVGTPRGILSFDADVPIALPELLEAVRVVTDTSRTYESSVPVLGSAAPTEIDQMLSSSRARPEQVVWLRMNAPAFDLYADIYTHGSIGPTIGLFVRDLDVAQTVQLYSATSGRYIFRSWLEAALTDIVGEQGVK